MTVLNEGGVFELINPVVTYINSILTNLVPNGELYIVGLATFLIAYGMKSKNNWNNFTMVIMAIVIYTSFRFFGVGK